MKSRRESKERVISKDSNFDQLVKNQIGPDSFSLQIVGPEIFINPILQFWKPSLYIFELEFLIAGDYEIEVRLVHDNFDALDDLHHEERTQWNTLILQTKIQIDLDQDSFDYQYFCSNKLNRWINMPISQINKLITSSPNPENINRRGVWISDCLPSCLSPMDTSLLNGSWVSLSNFQDLFDHQYSKSINVDQNSRALIWKPFLCSSSSSQFFFTPSKTRECLSNKKLFFQGDSHTHKTVSKIGYSYLQSVDFSPFNTLGESCFQYLNMTTPTTQNGVFYKREGIECGYTYSTNNVNIDLIFNFGRHGEEILIELDDYDAIIMNFGHWPSAQQLKHKGHWSFKQYEEKVTQLASSLMARYNKLNGSKKRPKLIWVSNVAFPEKYGVTTDWRNNYRMEVMNTIANSVMSKYNITIVDAFQVTLPLKISHDNNHYLSFQQDIIIQQILDIICK